MDVGLKVWLKDFYDERFVGRSQVTSLITISVFVYHSFAQNFFCFQSYLQVCIWVLHFLLWIFVLGCCVLEVSGWIYRGILKPRSLCFSLFCHQKSIVIQELARNSIILQIIFWFTKIEIETFTHFADPYHFVLRTRMRPFTLVWIRNRDSSTVRVPLTSDSDVLRNCCHHDLQIRQS